MNTSLGRLAGASIRLKTKMKYKIRDEICKKKILLIWLYFVSCYLNQINPTKSLIYVNRI